MEDSMQIKNTKEVCPKPVIIKKSYRRWTFQCEKEGCGRVLSSRKFFDRHMTNHANDRNDQEERVVETNKIADIAYHDMRDHCLPLHDHEMSVGCSHQNCNKAFVHARVLKTRLSSQSNERPHVCCKCKLNFKTVSAMNHHKKCVHQLNTYLHACGSCSATFQTRFHLISHIKIHMDPLTRPLFQCPECNRSVTTKYKLKSHIDTYHNNKKRVYECSFCRHSFVSKEDLQQHKKDLGHDSDKPFGCAICDVKYPSLAKLATHLKSDHPDRNKRHKLTNKCGPVSVINPFIIPSEQKLLTRHEQKRSFPCGVQGCMTAFKSNGNLKRHIETVHLNLRNYHCMRCGQTFGQRTNLNTHNNRHPDCGGTSRRKTTPSGRPPHNQGYATKLGCAADTSDSTAPPPTKLSDHQNQKLFQQHHQQDDMIINLDPNVMYILKVENESA